MYLKHIKPIFDFIFAISILIITSPVFILVSCILFLNNRGEIFFLQKRPGKNETIFKIIKFKTMTNLKDKKGELLPDKDRLTKLGQLVRKYSLDELPQLLNVIKGDMSIVGPRPLLPEYLMHYNRIQKKRHDVKPGITGLAQVNGRNTISWNKKFDFDIEYVKNVSFKLDLIIILNTFKKVLQSKDINQKGEATATPFTKEQNE